jgi:hypothetical protein
MLGLLFLPQALSAAKKGPCRFAAALCAEAEECGVDRAKTVAWVLKA